MKKQMKPRNSKAPFEYLYGHNSVLEALKAGRRKHASLHIAKDKKGVRFESVIQTLSFSELKNNGINRE